MAKTGATIQVADQVYDLLSETVTIGREADNMIVIDNQSVSAHHAEILYLAGQHVVRDIGSTNGTRVNGLATKETALQEGDSISFGVVECAFSGDAKSAKATSKPSAGGRGNLLLYGLGFAALTLFVLAFLVDGRGTIHGDLHGSLLKKLVSIQTPLAIDRDETVEPTPDNAITKSPYQAKTSNLKIADNKSKDPDNVRHIIEGYGFEYDDFVSAWHDGQRKGLIGRELSLSNPQHVRNVARVLSAVLDLRR